MFKAEDFISQKPSFKFQHYTSESLINTIEILYILESHIANSLCWPLIFKNSIIRADSLSLPCSASSSHDSLRCTLMNINTAACQSTTFDWQTLRGLINIHEQFLNVRAQPVLGVKTRSAYRRTRQWELLYRWCISPWTFCTTVTLCVIRVKRSTRKTCATQRRGEKIHNIWISSKFLQLMIMNHDYLTYLFSLLICH